jgi:antitoxin (DNA-binding transcriptional repressor) of toxin-antitoxin stability system
MKVVTIAEFKRDLPSLLGQVAKGESVILQKGRKRENVAILAPFKEVQGKTRELGLLAKRGKPVFKDWPMNEGDFLAYFP